MGNIGYTMSLGKNIVIAYLRVPKGHTESYDEAYIQEVVERHLRSACDSLEVFKVIDTYLWEHTMPKSSNELLARLQGEQGRDGVYFAGDHLGSPCMEVAIYSGMKAAKLLLGET